MKTILQYIGMAVLACTLQTEQSLASKKIFTSKDFPMVANLIKHNDWIISLALSKDGKYLFSGADDKIIKIWDIHDPKNAFYVTELKGHTNCIRSFVLSNDGDYLFSGSKDETIKIWDIHDPKNAFYVTELTGYEVGVSSLVLSKDGTYLFSGSDDETTKIWDIRDPKKAICVKELTGHNSWVRSLVLNKDGNYLFYGSDDKTIKIWDIHDPKNAFYVTELTGHNRWVLSLVLSKDGHYLFSGSNDKTIKIWQLPKEMCVDKNSFFLPDSRFMHRKKLIPQKNLPKPKFMDLKILFDPSYAPQKQQTQDYAVNNDLEEAIEKMLLQEQELKKLVNLSGYVLLTNKNGNKAQFNVLIKKTTTLFSLITSLLTTYEAYKEDIIKTVQEYCLPTIKISLSRIKAIYKNWGENNLIKHEESWQQLIIDDSEKLLYNYSLCKRELGTDAFGLDEEITRVEESFNMFLRLQEKMQEKSTAKKLEHLGNVD